MLYVEDGALVGSDKAVDTISSIAAAIAYAAITDRLDQAVNMSHTLVQLVHSCTDGYAIAFTAVQPDEDLVINLSKAVEASSYVAKLRFDEWVQEDSKNDS